MDQAVLHFLIPLIIIRILSGSLISLDKRLILLLSPLTILPDLDFFIFYHRATFHNISFGIFAVIISIIVLKRYFKPWKIAFVSSFFFLMHLVLDNGAVIWLYPFARVGYSFSGQKVTLEGLQILPHFSSKFMILSITGVILLFSLLFLEIVIEQRIKKHKKKN